MNCSKCRDICISKYWPLTDHKKHQTNLQLMFSSDRTRWQQCTVTCDTSTGSQHINLNRDQGYHPYMRKRGHVPNVHSLDSLAVTKTPTPHQISFTSPPPTSCSSYTSRHWPTFSIQISQAYQSTNSSPRQRWTTMTIPLFLACPWYYMVAKL
jgi:hypothetical protein